MQFEPTRVAGLKKLQDFVPKSGKDYASKRNFDLGPGRHAHVSTLSPYIRHRLLTEEDVLRSVLGRYSLSTAEKFVQEVYWRTYWKGWLELRPEVWAMYRSELKAALNRSQSEAGLRAEYEAACLGETEIEAFNFWAQELVNTGYLHNHARMWFASIWIFTLRLPWTLGADFFLRHLLDGDPASNTLSWRWVAGLQTQGKTYLARSSNIEKFTDGRFRPSAHSLAADAPALDGPPVPPRGEPPQGDQIAPDKPTAILLHDEDLSPTFVAEAIAAQRLTPVGSARLSRTKEISPLMVSETVERFKTGAQADMMERHTRLINPDSPHFSHDDDIPKAVAWAKSSGAAQVVTAYAPVGPTQEWLSQFDYRLRQDGIILVRILRPYDAKAWPHATAGFFKFKEKIPQLVGELTGSA